MNKTLKGIIPPMITPLLGRDTLDTKGLDNLIEHILGGGVHGLFILGTTGEGPSLSYRLRYELIERTCKQVGGRVPVLVGITDTSFTESIKMANISKEHGAEAVVLAPPFYFPAGNDELQEYFTDIISEINLPVYLYNMPSHTKLNIAPETVLEIVKLPGVHGIKDSSGNMVYFNNILKKLKDEKNLSLLVGPEELLAESLFLGADGGVNGGANFFPELYVKLYNAAQINNWVTVRELHSKIMDISTTIYSVGKFGSSYLKGIKSALNYMGICSDFMAEPFHAFKQPEREKVKEHLKKLKLLK